MTNDLRRLQGVWFPTHMTVEGRLIREADPSFPAPQGVALLTIAGDTFHVSSNADYYWTGGRLRLFSAPPRLEYVYPFELPDEFRQTPPEYVLTGDELLVCSRKGVNSRPHDVDCTTRYVRVAAAPTAEMAALFEEMMRTWPPGS